MNRRFISLLALWVVILCPSAQADSTNWRPATNSIATPWTDKVDPTSPLPEYPRPQMVRKDWTNLNGLWNYAITSTDSIEPGLWQGKILVPFCVESALSGVKKPLDKDHALWYTREFPSPDLTGGKRLLLHFGAVDWEAKLWINGKEIGSHQGGYDSFSFDITEAVKPSAVNRLSVRAWNPTGANGAPIGKQHFEAIAKPGGILYTPCSGIWQTVWLETVEAEHIERLDIRPDLDLKTVTITAHLVGPPVSVRVIVDVIVDGKNIYNAAIDSGGAMQTAKLILPIRDVKPWTPESPHLYDLHVTALQDGRQTDFVESYFAMRKISLGKDNQGITRLMLNNEPIFLAGPLDQGYWPDGIYTAPTDDALKYDIEITKKLGFNATRKHVKVEPERWYTWCDKLGLIVWQDMPSGGVAKTRKEANQTVDVAEFPERSRQFEKELRAMIEQHTNHPSIVMWTVFNEGWGEYDTPRLTEMVKNLDPTRLVDDASGWNDEKVGDVRDMHHYPAPAVHPLEENRAAVLGEFGGLGLPVPGHKWVEGGPNWGYQNMSGDTALTRKYIDLWREVWRLRKEGGLCAAIYTQLTDVETESNGLLSYDRKVIKIDQAKGAAAVAKGEFPPAPKYEVIMPTAQNDAVSWRYTMTKPANDDWIKPDFNASSWKEGPAGFGQSASDQGKVRTEWKSDDIWLRREFDLSTSLDGGNLVLRCYHDDDAEVYFNGVTAVKLRRWNDEYDDFDVLPQAVAALKAGRNVVAIHCHQVTGGQYIDAGILKQAP